MQTSHPRGRLFALLVAIVSISSCVPLRVTTIRFVFPIGFHGRVKLVLDEHGKQFRATNGFLVIHVPEDGSLRVKDFAPFDQRHKYEAFFADGTRIPVENDAGVTADTVALRSLGTHWHQHMEYPPVEAMLYFVGTEPEMHEYMRRGNDIGAPDPF
jgi:hypothetical protein